MGLGASDTQTSGSSNNQTLVTGVTNSITAAIQDAFTKSQSTSDTSSTGTSSTSSSNTVVNSADPVVKAMLLSLANTATGNAEDSNDQTSDLVAGIFQSAKDSFANVLGNQGSAGLYNSSTTGVLASDAQARATADAASAVLGYKTQQQGLADTALSQLLSATGTQSSSGVSNTSTAGNQISNTLSTGSTITDTNTTENTNTNTLEKGNSNSGTNTAKADASLDTVVCTWMLEHDLMERKKYLKVHLHFSRNYPKLAHQAYLVWGRRFVRILNTYPNSLCSRLILSVFGARTNYICGERSFYNFFSTWLLLTLCFPSYIWLLIRANIPKIFTPEPEGKKETN